MDIHCRGLILIVEFDYGEPNFRSRVLFSKLQHFEVQLLLLTSRGRQRDEGVAVFRRRDPFSILRKVGLKKLANTLSHVTYFPSNKVLYYRNLRECVLSIRNANEGIQIYLVTIAPPHDIGYLGLMIKREFPDIKWVVDLQDIWSIDEYQLSRVSMLSKSKVRKVEKEMFSLSDAIVCTNPRAEEKVRELAMGDVNAVSIVHPAATDITPNQVRLEDFPLKAEISFSFVGTFVKKPKVDGESFVKVLNDYVEIYSETAILRLIGDSVKSQLSFDLNSGLIIEEFGRKSHRAAFEIASHSLFQVVLLADVPVSRTIMHGKISHLLKLKRPILAIGPKESYLEDFMRSTWAGYFLDVREFDARRLHEVIEMARANVRVCDKASVIQEYSESTFVSRWESLLGKLAS